MSTILKTYLRVHQSSLSCSSPLLYVTPFKHVHVIRSMSFHVLHNTYHLYVFNQIVSEKIASSRAQDSYDYLLSFSLFIVGINYLGFRGRHTVTKSKPPTQVKRTGYSAPSSHTSPGTGESNMIVLSIIGDGVFTTSKHYVISLLTLQTVRTSARC
jgi:hypothetical protein